MPVPELAMQLGSLSLKTPVVCGAGEHVADEAGLRAAVDAGAAAVVGKSANESDHARRQWEARRWVVLDGDHEPVDDPARAPGGSLLNRSGLVPVPWQEWIGTLARVDEHARAQ